MGKNSAIEWTDHTLNLWWGCIKVSPGCKFCYAENVSNRYGYDVWGPSAGRRFFSDKLWRKIENWNREAAKNEKVAQVFCGSMCDIMEIHSNPIVNNTMNALRLKMWETVDKTQFLRWLFLTKRPENIEELFPMKWVHDGFPHNAWIGVSIEDLFAYSERIEPIKNLNVKKFASVEPLIDRIHCFDPTNFDWVIVGGESQPGCRRMEIEWAQEIVDNCLTAGVPVFVKQLGGWPDKRNNIETFPEGLRVRQFPC